MVLALELEGRNTNHLGHDAADFRWGIKLALAPAALAGEVPHQVLVGIAQEIVVVGAILGEIQRWGVKNVDEVTEPLNLVLAVTQFVGVVKIGEVASG